MCVSPKPMKSIPEGVCHASIVRLIHGRGRGKKSAADSSDAYESLGEAYQKSGEKQPAVESYKKALEKNPENSDAKEKLEALEAVPAAK